MAINYGTGVSPAASDLGRGMGDNLTAQLRQQEEERRKKRMQQQPAASMMGPAAMSLLGEPRGV